MTMETLVLASNNSHKLGELRRMLGDTCRVLSLREIGCLDDIPEDGTTFEENALQKARWVYDRYGYDCIADDSGLEVDALGGAPGVYSARYAGVHGDDAANNARLLDEMRGRSDRRARFRCVMALVRKGFEPQLFAGHVEGVLLEAPDGIGGFGYDPLFVPEGWSKSFARASGDEKNAVSHRGDAVRKLVAYLGKK